MKKLKIASANPHSLGTAVVACFALALTASPALAQNNSVNLNRGGFIANGANELNGIRADARGLNNSIASITNNTLQNSRGFRPNVALSEASAASASLSAPSFTPSRPASKPFANNSSAPTVSPYLGLFNTGVIGDEIDNYNTFVRPQLRQQQFNNQVQRQAAAINARFQQLSAQPAFNPQGSRNMMGTGHTTTFGYYSHFYPTRR